MLSRLFSLNISHKLKLTFYREQCLLVALAFGLRLSSFRSLPFIPKKSTATVLMVWMQNNKR